MTINDLFFALPPPPPPTDPSHNDICPTSLLGMATHNHHTIASSTTPTPTTTLPATMPAPARQPLQLSAHHTSSRRNPQQASQPAPQQAPQQAPQPVSWVDKQVLVGLNDEMSWCGHFKNHTLEAAYTHHMQLTATTRSLLHMGFSLLFLYLICEFVQVTFLSTPFSWWCGAAVFTLLLSMHVCAYRGLCHARRQSLSFLSHSLRMENQCGMWLSTWHSCPYTCLCVGYTLLSIIYLYHFRHQHEVIILLECSFITLCFQISHMLPLHAMLVITPSLILSCAFTLYEAVDPSRVMMLLMCLVVNGYVGYSRDQSMRMEWLLSSQVEGELIEALMADDC